MLPWSTSSKMCAPFLRGAHLRPAPSVSNLFVVEYNLIQSRNRWLSGRCRRFVPGSASGSLHNWKIVARPSIAASVDLGFRDRVRIRRASPHGETSPLGALLRPEPSVTHLFVDENVPSNIPSVTYFFVDFYLHGLQILSPPYLS